MTSSLDTLSFIRIITMVKYYPIIYKGLFILLWFQEITELDKLKSWCCLWGENVITYLFNSKNIMQWNFHFGNTQLSSKAPGQRNTTFHRAAPNICKPLLSLAQCCSVRGGQTNQTFQPTFLELCGCLRSTP